MEGARAPEFRPYWIRYIVAFWAGERLQWVRDNVFIACVCSLAPGLIAVGISAALSDDKWRAAANATLLTYGSLFALFLTWRLVSTPFELDRERQRFINRLLKKLVHAKFKLAALQASPPAIDVKVLELHVQAVDTTLASRALDIPVDRDIFLRVKLTSRETQPIGVRSYELSGVLHGNSSSADYVDDIREWGLVTEKTPVGIGTTFHYVVSKLASLARRVERMGVPVEGWLHFHLKGVHEKEIGSTIYRLNIVTRTGTISTDMTGERLAGAESGEFQKIHDVSTADGAREQ